MATTESVPLVLNAKAVLGGRLSTVGMVPGLALLGTLLDVWLGHRFLGRQVMSLLGLAALGEDVIPVLPKLRGGPGSYDWSTHQFSPV